MNRSQSRADGVWRDDAAYRLAGRVCIVVGSYPFVAKHNAARRKACVGSVGRGFALRGVARPWRVCHAAVG